MSGFNEAEGNLRGNAVANDGEDVKLAASRILSQQALENDQLTMAGVSGDIQRFSYVTGKGILNTPAGILHAIKEDINHPEEVLKLLGGSAVLGAALKVALPETGPVGKIAGLALGGYFLYSSAPGFVDAYQKGFEAKSWDDMQIAGKQWGNAAGQFTVDSGIGYVGFKAGSGMAGRALATERFDGFAESKHNFWKGVDNKLTSATSFLRRGAEPPVTRAESIEMRPKFIAEGDRATLLRTERPQPLGEVRGATDVNADMNVSVYVKSKGSEFLMDRHLARIASGKSGFLTDEQFGRKFGADPAALEQVKQFAETHNLSVAEADPLSGKVLLKGKAGDFGRAFSVELMDVAHPEGFTFRGRQGMLSVPRNIAPAIEGVYGLDQRPQARSRIVRPQPPTGNSAVEPLREATYLPNQVAELYNFPMENGGKGQAVAIVELGGGYDAKVNMRYYDDHGLARPEKINVITVDDAVNNPKDPSGATGEVNLDTQVIGAIAPKAEQNIIFGPNSDQGFIDTITRSTFPEKGETPNSAISISWGAPESGWTDQGLKGMNAAFKKAALKGISIFAASGDDGALDTARTYQADYPSSDPWVTATGGTKLVGANGVIKSEVAWNEGRRGGAGGGGISEKWPVPDYQQGLEMPPHANGHGRPGRGVPDIAGNADPYTGYITSDGVTGGTSAVSPLYSALTMLINAERGKPMGFLNPFLYKNPNASFFNDITIGDNNGYSTKNGWDAVTGWGSVNGRGLLEALKNDPVGKSQINPFAPPNNGSKARTNPFVPPNNGTTSDSTKS